MTSVGEQSIVRNDEREALKMKIREMSYFDGFRDRLALLIQEVQTNQNRKFDNDGGLGHVLNTSLSGISSVLGLNQLGAKGYEKVPNAGATVIRSVKENVTERIQFESTLKKNPLTPEQAIELVETLLETCDSYFGKGRQADIVEQWQNFEPRIREQLGPVAENWDPLKVLRK